MGSPGPNGNRWRLRGQRPKRETDAFNSAVTFAAADAYSLRRAIRSRRVVGAAAIAERQDQLRRSMEVVGRFLPCRVVDLVTGEVTALETDEDALAFVDRASR